MPPRIPNVGRPRPRVPSVAPPAASQAAFSHVLSLVQNGYLDTASKAAISTLRSTGSAAPSHASMRSVEAGPSTYQSLERRVPTPSSRQQFRLYSSSAAHVVEESHESPNSPAPTPYFGAPRSPRRSSPARLPSTAITEDKRFFRCLDSPGDWANLPPRMRSRLKNGGFQSAAHFAHDYDAEEFPARRMGSVSNLFRIFALWKETAEYEDWVWLAEKLTGLIEHIESLERVPQRALPSLVTAIRAYVQVSIGAEEEANKLLASKHMAARDNMYTQPTGHAIAALAYAKLENWERAAQQIAICVNKGVTRISSQDRQVMDYPSYDYDLLQEYESSVLAVRRDQDLLDVVDNMSFQTRHFIINASKAGHKYPATISRFLLDALYRIESPVEWWREHYAKDPTFKTSSLGALLILALTQDRSRLPEVVASFNALTENNLVIPSHVGIDICAKLAIESKPDAWLFYQKLRATGTKFGHHSLYRALQLAGRLGWTQEEEKIWQDICDNHYPSFKDRTVGAITHAYHGRVQSTIDSLRTRLGERFEGDAGALEIIFGAHINANDADGAYLVLQKINAIEPRNYPYNALLQLYADQVNASAAVRLFDEFLASPLTPDLHSYTALISLFAHRRDPMNANNCFRAMIEAGIEPDHVAYGAIINAEVESGDWAAAAKRWSELPQGIKYHRSVTSAIIRALVLLSSPTEHVISLFRKITKPSARTWALVIQSASDSGDMGLARDLFEEMEQTLRENNKSGESIVYSMSILLHGYMHNGDGMSARAVYDEMVKREIVPSSITYGMIIQSFAEARGERSLEQAHDFAMNVHKQAQAGIIADRRHQKSFINQNIFSPLLVAHGRSQNWEMAQSYFDMIGVDESKESVHILSQLMDVQRRAGEVDKVLETWNKTFQLALEMASFRNPTGEDELGAAEKPLRSNDNILCIPLSIALDSLSVVGRYHDVKRIWNDVEVAGFGFDAGNYNHLCVALARTGDVQGAFMVADQILLKRYDEVMRRKNEAVRESVDLPSLKEIDKRNGRTLDEGEMQEMLASAMEEGEEGLDVVDRPVAPFYGPPNRRGAMHRQSPFTPEAKLDPSAQLDLRLLQSWRPSDTLWKPSLLTLSVLDTAYAQLEEASRRRAWVPLTFSDEAENEENENDSDREKGLDADFKPNKRTYGVVLPLFGNIPVRNHMTGLPSRKGPKEILIGLNRRYSKIVGLIMFHRKKRMADKLRQDRLRQKKK